MFKDEGDIKCSVEWLVDNGIECVEECCVVGMDCILRSVGSWLELVGRCEYGGVYSE